MGVTHRPGPAAARLKIAMSELAKVRGQVGWFSSAKYSDGTPVAYVATIQEFGSPAEGIPPRPFMRPTIAQQQAIWGALARGWSKKVARGQASARDMMDRIGLQAAGDISKTIVKLTSPALAAGTISARLRKRKDRKTVGNLDKPLVDTGLMLATITHTVEES